MNNLFKKVLLVIAAVAFTSSAFAAYNPPLQTYNQAFGIGSSPYLTQPTATNIFQRDTVTGGAFGLGAGTVGISVNLAVPVQLLEYRLRSAAAPGTTLVDWTQFATASVAGSNSFTPTIPAGPNLYYIDVRTNGYTPGAQLGNQAFGVGEVIAFSGQSEAANMAVIVFGNSPATLAATRVTVPSNGFVSAPFDNNNSYGQTWQVSSDAGPYNSAFAPEFLGLVSGQTGVVSALVGHALGGSAISLFAPPSSAIYTKLRSVLDPVGKFGAFLWIQGAGDALAGTTASAYTAGLTAFMSDLEGRYKGPGGGLGTWPRLMSCVGAIITPNGTQQAMTIIKAAQKAYVAADSLGTYMDLADVEMSSDGLHGDQNGHRTEGFEFYRAWASARGFAAVNPGPVLTSAVRASGSNVVTLNFSLSSGATSLVAVKNAWTTTPTTPSASDLATQFQAYVSPLTFSGGVPQSPYTVTSAVISSATQIQLTLSSTPSDALPVDIYPRMYYDTTNAVAVGLYDNNVADGFPAGRQMIMTAAPVTAPAPVPGAYIAVNTPSGVTTASATTISGTYSAPAPTGINYLIDSGAYTAATSPTISGGNYSFSVPSGAFSAGPHTITVQEANATSVVATSAAFTSIAPGSYPTIASASTLAYFDASAGVTASGGVVSALADQSGLGHSLTNGSYTGPTLTASSQNGLPGLTFAGAQGLQSSAAWFSGTSGLQGSYTALFVFKAANFNNAAAYTIGVAGSTSAVNSTYISPFSTGVQFVRQAASGAPVTDTGAKTVNTLYKVVVTFDAATGIQTLKVNTDAAQTATVSTSGMPGTAWNTFLLGQFTTSGLALSGVIYEADFYNGAANSGDVSALMSYATSKWGS